MAGSSNNRTKSFVLQKVQPGLLGLMDGAVSTLAPIFAAAGLTGKPASAFFCGIGCFAWRSYLVWVLPRRSLTMER